MKRLLVLFVFLLTVLYSYTVIAQGMGPLRKSIEISFPEKIQKLVLDPLPAGTYSIGAGGYFPTIDSAFNKLSIDGIAGEVILELIDNLYTAPTSQFGFFLNGPIPGAGPNSRVTIKPATDKNVTITGAGGITLSFMNTSFVIVDGVSLIGPSTLTIHTLKNNQFSWNDGIQFIDNSDTNIIKNILFVNEDYSSARGCPVLFWSLNNLYAPDGNLIENNFIKKAGIAIVISAYFSDMEANNNIIRGNIIGSETDTLINCGIQVTKNKNSIIENNYVHSIRGIVTNDFTFGINFYWSKECIIRNNVVHNVSTNVGFGSTGILLSGGGTTQQGNDNQIYNNIVSDIQSNSLSASRVAGIQMWSQNNPKIYYNSVYLTGTASGANPLGSAALYIYHNIANADVKNNIFVNTRDESPFCASSMFDVSSTNLTSNYNDLYYDDSNANNCLVNAGGTDYLTLADWQVTGQDLNSITEMPHFSDSYLHIDKTFPTYLERGATPIAGITTDFDGDLRNVTTPDIGADEFDGYTFEDPLPAWTYSVGTGGNFETIQHCFNILSQYGVAGNVTLELIDELYTAPAGQYGFSLNGPIPGAGTNSRVTIKPAENKNVTIQHNGEAVLYFLNTSYVTIDGIDLTGATTLTIHALQNSSYVYNDALDFINNSDHNVIQNITFIVDDNTRASGSGFWYTQTGSAVPDSNLIQNNFVKKAGVAFYIVSSGPSVMGKDNIIRGNKIGSETDSLITSGIQVQRCENTIIENNIIQNLKATLPGIDEPKTGILLIFGLNNIIRNNSVSNLRANSGYTCTGIFLFGNSGDMGNNNYVYNNMVYDIQSSSTQGDSRVSGIQLWYQNNTKIYYNSVFLSGTGASHQGSGALYIWSNCTNVESKNNILVNTRDESPYCASTIYNHGSTNLASDYNDLYYDDSNNNNCLVKAGSTNYLTLAEWQATGQDSNSVSEMPNFVSPDLHIDSTIYTLLDKHATPIAGITTDIDNNPRNLLTPDIGADEFDIITGIEGKSTPPIEFVLEQNFPNPFNPSTTFRYSIPQTSKVVIKVYDILGNEITTLMNEEKSVGTYELTWNATTLPSGVYFYQLKAGDFIDTKKMLLLK